MAPGAMRRSRVSTPEVETELVMIPCMGENDINASRRPLGATACSMAIAALVPFPAFFEGPRVSLGRGVVAASVIMMGRGKNGQALKKVT